MGRRAAAWAIGPVVLLTAGCTGSPSHRQQSSSPPAPTVSLSFDDPAADANDLVPAASWGSDSHRATRTAIYQFTLLNTGDNPAEIARVGRSGVDLKLVSTSPKGAFTIDAHQSRRITLTYKFTSCAREADTANTWALPVSLADGITRHLTLPVEGAARWQSYLYAAVCM